jgi:hypothetical protein
MFIDGLTIAGIISTIPIVLFLLVYGRTIPEEQAEEHRESSRLASLDCCATER